MRSKAILAGVVAFWAASANAAVVPGSSFSGVERHGPLRQSLAVRDENTAPAAIFRLGGRAPFSGLRRDAECDRF
jgi:hypothetical protein